MRLRLPEAVTLPLCRAAAVPKQPEGASSRGWVPGQFHRTLATRAPRLGLVRGAAWHVMACCGTLDAVLLLSLALRHHEAVLLVPLLDLSPLPVEEHLDA